MARQSRGFYAKQIGDQNTARVREFFQQHLCATNRECSEALGLSVFAVGRHVEKIRAEWPNAAAEPCLTAEEQKAQGLRCGCWGADDYCVCQNVPDAETRAQRALAARPTP